MKFKLLIILFCYLAVSPAGCNDKNVQPVFPANLQANQKSNFMDEWTAGKELFKANCAKCHGVFTPGKDSISNFTSKQIDFYTAGFLARDPKNHSVMQQMSSNDFGKILFFLTYLKRKEQQTPPPFTPNGGSQGVKF